MCQLCAIKQIAAKDRWPKPVEAQKSDLIFLVESVHDAYEAYRQQKEKAPTSTPPTPLLDTLRLVVAQLDSLESDREKWWTSPDKRALRQRLEHEGEQRKLSDLHRINNACVASIEALSAKVGGFVKWGLGLNGGVWELMHCDQVAAARPGVGDP